MILQYLAVKNNLVKNYVSNIIFLFFSVKYDLFF